jgi:hypothetical protein
MVAKLKLVFLTAEVATLTGEALSDWQNLSI